MKTRAKEYPDPLPVRTIYKLHYTSNRRVGVATSPTAKKTSRVIYGIFDSHDDKVLYVGKTGQVLTRRISWYTCMVNKAVEGKPVERAKIIQKLAADPTRYYFKILDEAPSDRSLSDLEESIINKYNPTFNSNKG